MSEAQPAGQPVRFLAPEDQARANMYGLIGRLFYAAPDATLLQALAQADDAPAEIESAFATAWKVLVGASRDADPAAVREEYERVFIGTGKAEVTLYVGAYTARSTADSPLAELRGSLAALGLGRRGDAYLPEDHLGALCDAMRHLVATQQYGLEVQQEFFQRWIVPVAPLLCNAIQASARTNYYKHVGELARSFFELELAAFQMR